MGLMGLIGLMGLMGCSEDYEPESRQRVTFEAMPCTTTFEEDKTADTREWGNTRSWNPSSPYFAFDDAVFAQQKSLVNKSIGVFFTQDTGSPQEGTFYYNDRNSEWNLSMDIDGGDYYLYGYIPSEDVDNATITGNSNYSSGAVLTLHGVKTVTPSDVCVIVGAKDGTGEETVTGLATGDFSVRVNATSGSTDNYIFLLFDHLYSALRFRFTVDTDYARLRTIKLRRLELIAYKDGSETRLKAKYNVAITLTANDTETSPIGSVAFTPDASSADLQMEPIFEGTEELSPTTPSDFMGCFVPSGFRYFKLRSTYDVYDKATPTPNLIREGCRAENAINLESIFGVSTTLERGKRNVVNMTVQPTYLYVLSEPDLDNPTVTLAE